ncbi:MAG: hypothetical protein SNJ77_05705, partial [Cytophagales bacterium]
MGLLPLDLNGDAVQDFSFGYEKKNDGFLVLWIEPLSGSQLIVRNNKNLQGQIIFKDLPLGDEISNLTHGGAVWSDTAKKIVLLDNWLKTTNSNGFTYLGVRIKSGINWLFGKIELSFTSERLIVNSYYLETTDNQPLVDYPVIQHSSSNSNSHAISFPSTPYQISVSTSTNNRFCDKTMTISLNQIPDKDIKIFLNSTEKDGSPTMEFFENGVQIEELTFLSGTNQLVRNIAFNSFKYLHNQSSWSHTFDFRVIYDEKLISHTFNLASFIPNNFQFTYNQTLSKNIKDVLVFAGQQFERRYYFENPGNVPFSGHVELDEELARALEVKEAKIWIVNESKYVSGQVIKTEIYEQNSGQSAQTKPKRFRYFYRFDNLSFNGAFEFIQLLSAKTCDAPDMSYSVSNITALYSCSPNGQALNNITNQVIQSNLVFRKVDPNINITISSDSEYKGCFDCDIRNYTLELSNKPKNVTDSVGIGYISPLVFYGFNGNAPLGEGKYSYTWSGELRTTVVPVKSLKLTIHPSYYELLDLDSDTSGLKDGIVILKRVKGREIKKHFTTQSNYCIEDDEYYVEFVEFKFKRDFPIYQTEWFAKISYTSIQLCPIKMNSVGFSGNGLTVNINSLSGNSSYTNPKTTNTFWDGCFDVHKSSITLYSAISPSENVEFRNLAIEYKYGASELTACSSDRSDCSYEKLFQPLNTNRDYTEDYIYGLGGEFNSRYRNLPNVEVYSNLIIELETKHNIIPAPINNQLDGNLFLATTGLRLNPDEIVVVKNVLGNKKIKYRFNILSSAVKLNPFFLNNGRFDINLFFQKLNLYFSLSATCDEPFIESNQSEYSINFFVSVSGTDCNACDFPIGKVKSLLFVNCPGCVNLGLETNFFELERIRDNTSLFDYDNDGLPDDENLDNGLPNKGILLNRAVTGDYIKANTSTSFWDGTKITNQQLIDSAGGVDFLKYLYRVDIFGKDLIDGIEIDYQSLRLTIKRNNIVFDLGNLDGKIQANILKDNGYVLFQISGEDIKNFMSLNYPIIFLPANRAFLPGDIYDIECKYLLKGGYAFRSKEYKDFMNLSESPELFIKHVEAVVTSVFLGRDRKCTTGCKNVDSDLADQKTITQLLSDSTLRYLCTSNSRSFTFYDYSIVFTQSDGIQSFIYNPIYHKDQPCEIAPNLILTSFTGQSSLRHFYNMPKVVFPHEYRPIRIPKDILLEIPKGYVINEKFPGEIVNFPISQFDLNAFEKQNLILGQNCELIHLNGKKYLKINPIFDPQKTRLDKFDNFGYTSGLMRPNDVNYFFIRPHFVPEKNCEQSKYFAYRTNLFVSNDYVLTELNNILRLLNKNPTADFSNTSFGEPIRAKLVDIRNMLKSKDFPISVPDTIEINDDFLKKYSSMIALIERNSNSLQISGLNQFVNKLNEKVSFQINYEKDIENVLMSFNTTGITINSLKINGHSNLHSVNSNGIVLIPRLSRGTHVLEFEITLNQCELGDLKILIGYNCDDNFNNLSVDNFIYNICFPEENAIGIEIAQADYNFHSIPNVVQCDNQGNFFTLTNKIIVNQGSLNSNIIRLPKQEGMLYIQNSSFVTINGQNYSVA